MYVRFIFYNPEFEVWVSPCFEFCVLSFEFCVLGLLPRSIQDYHYQVLACVCACGLGVGMLHAQWIGGVVGCLANVVGMDPNMGV